MSTTIHPSRTAPACATCRFCITGFAGTRYCNHPSVPADVVTGGPAVRAYDCRRDVSDQKLGYQPCGTAGTLFEPAVRAFQVLAAKTSSQASDGPIQ